MSDNKLKLGFIGGAINSAVGYAHFSACKMDDKFQLVAGCFSRNENVSKETANLYGVSSEHCYTDWKEMLQKEKSNVDAISILTPTPTHKEMVLECLKRGIPVICEKTLAMNSGDAIEIQQELIKQNGFLAVTYNYTGYPMIRELKHIIKSGKLGKILHFQAQMPQEGFIRINKDGQIPKPQKWRLQDKTIPTIHLDLCSHLHEIIHYLLDSKPISVISDQASDGWFKNIIDNVTCLCRYENDIQGQIWFSKSALGYRNGLSISVFGTEGSATWIQTNPEELIVARNDGTKEIIDRASNNSEIASKLRYTRFKAGHPTGFIEAFANIYFDIAKAINEYKETNTWNSNEIFGIDLATEGLLFLEAMVESSKIKSWKNIN